MSDHSNAHSHGTMNQLMTGFAVNAKRLARR